MAARNGLGPRSEPAAHTVSFSPLDSTGRTGNCTGGLTATEVAFRCLAGCWQSEHRTERTRNTAQVTSDANVVQHHLRPGLLIHTNSIYRTGRHAPRFLALHASIWCIAGLLVENVYANHRVSRGEHPCLHKRTGQFALHATRAAVGYNLQRSGHRFDLPLGCACLL